VYDTVSCADGGNSPCERWVISMQRFKFGLMTHLEKADSLGVGKHPGSPGCGHKYWAVLARAPTVVFRVREGAEVRLLIG
jgi:hypothetical protein